MNHNVLVSRLIVVLNFTAALFCAVMTTISFYNADGNYCSGVVLTILAGINFVWPVLRLLSDEGLGK